MNTIKVLAIDGGMAVLLYFGLFEKTPYLNWVFWALFVVFVALYVVMSVAYQNDEVAQKIRANRQPSSKLKNLYSIAYDSLFAIALALSGYIFSAIVWWTCAVIAKNQLERMDKETRIERGERA